LHALGIRSPSTVTRDNIGIPLAQGVIVGFEQGIGNFGNIVSDNLDSQFVIAMKKSSASWKKMFQDTMKEAVAGPTALGDIANINAIASQQAADAQAISDFTAAYVDTSFATPGYTYGMTPAQVYALPGNQTSPVTVNINGPVYGADSTQLAQSVQQEFLRMQAQGTVLGFA
jgi:hypothetical protein